MVLNNSKFYRFEVDGIGIYEAVDRDCKKDDSRRANKPDGSWLPKKGINYLGAVSFWSEVGLQRYRDSGLLDWHKSVLNGEVRMITIGRPVEILYEDEYQIIIKPELLVTTH
ncbi:MAG: hypothetical protein EXS50_00035 [Candidatus Taylorbacteria bacterium]|nr:hypothetical protein [Candidatus Taylorbacteria bacterium]